MENLPQEQRKQRLIQSKPSEKGEIITYLSQMGDVLEQIFERHEIIALCVFRVHIVVDCNVPNAEHGEALLNIETGVKLVSAKAAEVLGYDDPNLPVFHVRDHLLKCGSLEVTA